MASRASFFIPLILQGISLIVWSEMLTKSLIKDVNDECIDQNIEDFKKQTFTLFQIDIVNYLELKFMLMYKCRMQPSEVEKLDYYELEYTVENWKKWLDKEKEAHDEEEKKSKGSTYKQDRYMQDAGNMVNKYGVNKNSMPSTAATKSLANVKMPNIPSSPGNFKMPKM
jgi:hypothetical protein